MLAAFFRSRLVVQRLRQLAGGTSPHPLCLITTDSAFTRNATERNGGRAGFGRSAPLALATA
jgi:hypothetical protein